MSRLDIALVRNVLTGVAARSGIRRDPVALIVVRLCISAGRDDALPSAFSPSRTTGSLALSPISGRRFREPRIGAAVVPASAMVRRSMEFASTDGWARMRASCSARVAMQRGRHVGGCEQRAGAHVKMTRS
jgi:hypothetical protein